MNNKTLFDPANPVVQLCTQGMQAEALGKTGEARALFERAWEKASGDAERFIAAHYLARHQSDAQQALKWNLEALQYASSMVHDELKEHFPSLYLNVGKSYETLGEVQEATRYYRLAATACADLPGGQYRDMIRSGVKAGLQRVGAFEPTHLQLDRLVQAWCDQKELRPLSMLLPAYLADLGTMADREKLVNVLSMISAMRCLSAGDQNTVNGIIGDLAPV